jgi:ribosomal-protein-alanine N-acetyltransferase
MDDARFINNLRQDEIMEKMLGGAIRPVSYERDLKWVDGLAMNDNQSIIYYAITTLHSDEIIGYTSISEIDYKNGTCFWSGIKVDAAKAGKGIGTQVALKILTQIFEQLRMVRCRAECLEHHTPALKMMLKVGYKQEGLMRKTLFKNGVYNNQWLCSVTDDDYAEIKQQFQL